MYRQYTAGGLNTDVSAQPLFFRPSLPSIVTGLWRDSLRALPLLLLFKLLF